MNPYMFNQYALAQQQLASLAQYNASNPASGAPTTTSTAATTTSSTNGGGTTNLSSATDAASVAINPYAAAMATNGALAQAAALTAYTSRIVAAQQQINNGMMALNQQQSMNGALALNSNNTDLNGLNGIETVENEEEDVEDHGKSKKNKLVVEHDGFYNMKPLLAENILSSDYFKSLYRFKTYHEVIDETCRFCKNVEPLMVGLSRKPSTAFCILYKFFRYFMSALSLFFFLSLYRWLCGHFWSFFGVLFWSSLRICASITERIGISGISPYHHPPCTMYHVTIQ